MERELLRFFEEVDDYARPLTKEIYQEQLRLADRRSELSKREYGLEQQFDKDRLLPKNQGLVFVDTKRSSEKRFQKFEQDWNDTLQVMRSIASRVSAPGAKPAWIDASVAPGVQADQFLHAYYYKQVKDGNRHPYEEFFDRNSRNPELALRDALEWWHDADFDHSFEERTIYEWSPRLRELLARDRILKLTEQEFVDAVSRVHAIRDHAIKQENEQLEIWFGIFQRKTLKNASFKSIAQLRQAIHDFTAAYNQNAAPFVWRKREVRGAQLRNTIVNLRN